MARESLGEAVLDLRADRSKLDRDMGDAERGVRGFLGKIQDLASRAFSFALGDLLAGGIRQIVGGIKQLSSTALQAVGDVQTLEMGLEGLLTQGLMYERLGAGSYRQVREFGEASALAKEQVGDLLQFLDELSIKSPFESKQVAEVARLGVAAGLSADEVQRFTEAFLDYSAVQGITSKDLSFAAEQFLQLRKIGKLTQVDLRQLRRLGIDVERILGVKLGMSVEQFNKQVERSPELMDKLFDAFVEMSGEGAAGAAERMASTLPGLMSNLRDIIEVGSRNLFRPMIEAATPYVADIVDTIGEFVTGDKIKALGERLGESLGLGISGVFKLLGGDRFGLYDIGAGISNLFGMDAAQRFIDVGQAIFGIVDGIGNLRDRLAELAQSDLAQQIGGIFETLAGFAQGRAPGALDDSMRVLGALFDTVGGFAKNEALPWLLEQIEKIANYLNDNQDLINDASARWAEAFENVIGILGALGSAEWAMLSGTLEGLLDLTLGLADAFMRLSTGDTAGALDSLGKGIAGLAEGVGTGFEDMANVVTGWFDTTWPEVMETWEGNWEMFKGIVEGVWKEITRRWDEHVASIKRGANKIAGFFTTTIPNAIQDGKQAIIDKIEEFKQAGIDLIEGLRQGIREAKDRVKNMISELAGDIPDWLRSFLGARSPARVMIPVGVSVPQGVGVGIEKGIEELKRRTFPRLERELNLSALFEPQVSPAFAFATPVGGDTFQITIRDVRIDNELDIRDVARGVVREIQRHRREGTL